MEHYIVNTDKYSELLFSCDMCETEIIIMVRKALTWVTNILLNDYTTAQSEKIPKLKLYCISMLEKCRNIRFLNS